MHSVFELYTFFLKKKHYRKQNQLKNVNTNNMKIKKYHHSIRLNLHTYFRKSNQLQNVNQYGRTRIIHYLMRENVVTSSMNVSVNGFSLYYSLFLMAE